MDNSTSPNTLNPEEHINTLLTKLNQRQYTDRIERNNIILDVIRIKQPISKYGLAKITGISYPTIKRILKEFEFCDLIMTKISMSINNMPVQLVSISNQDKIKSIEEKRDAKI